ncbi:MAG: YqgE/AlgH family protein [Acidobacteria bacterium]|nr:YqgE/AlgH family protein [Acidobacteriota bacterium]
MTAAARRTWIVCLTVAVAIVLSAGLLAGERSSAAGQGGRRLAVDLAPGTLLVASRGLGDRNFFETVVVLIAATKDGTAGLVLNRQTKVAIERILPGLPVAKPAPGLVFLGGPVEMTAARALVRSVTARRDLRVLDGVYLLDSREKIADDLSAGAGPDRFRLYVGFAGWGAGQLEREIAAGAWHLLDGDASAIFDPAPDTLWRRLIRLTEGLAA